MSFFDYLADFPLAAVSAGLTYAVALGLIFPATRQVLSSWLLMPASRHQSHVQGLDALRGIAAAAVALGHCVWMTRPSFEAAAEYFPLVHQAHKAVPVFCTISGFLIFRALASVETLPDLRSYALRRFFRIYPAYLLSVLIALAMMQYAQSVMAPATTSFARFIADLSVFRLLWWPGFGNPAAWSLYHEVLFYALLPFVVLVFGRQRMLAVCGVGLLLMLLGDYPSRDFGLWKYFLVGIAASELTGRLRPWAIPMFIASCALFAIDVVGIDWFHRAGLTPERADGETFGLAIACFLLLASLPNLGRLVALTELLPFRIIGSISYSIFLLHPFYILANFPEIGSLIYILGDKFQPLPNSISFFWLVFFPGVFFWGMLGFALVEKPGILLGRRLTGKGRGTPSLQPAAAAAE